jgi:hypothetical protein
VAPYFISQYHIFGDFSNTGEIGSTIGGITAPFIGVLSIILLYLTLQSQQQQVQEMNEKGNITLLCNHLVKCIDNFHYTETNQKKKTIERKGAEAIASYLHVLYCHKGGLSFDKLTCDAIASELISILIMCKELLTMLDNSDIQDKSVFEILIKHQFEYRIYPEIKKNIGEGKSIKDLKTDDCKECGFKHGFDENIIDLITKLEERLIKNK